MAGFTRQFNAYYRVLIDRCCGGKANVNSSLCQPHIAPLFLLPLISDRCANHRGNIFVYFYAPATQTYLWGIGNVEATTNFSILALICKRKYKVQFRNIFS